MLSAEISDHAFLYEWRPRLVNLHFDGTADLLCRLAMRLRAGELVAALGLTATQAEAKYREYPPSRHVLALDLAHSSVAHRAIDEALNSLADLAGSLWPDWRPAQDDAPRVLAAWRRGAAEAVLAGRRPRFRSLAREVECECLCAALPDVILLAGVDDNREDVAGETIAALEWLARRGLSVIVAFAERPALQPPWDRLLSGAIGVPATAPDRISAPRVIAPLALANDRGSRLERRLRGALAADPGLAGLFEPEVVLDLGPMLAAPRVDMFWPGGKVVVELDGREHEREPTYAADRHRDYELLVAGYLVLRLTNDEVELDLGRSLEKVRRVVDLRRPPA